MTQVSIQQRNRNRAMLIAIFVIFFGMMFVAGALRFSGWRPAQMKNHGELLGAPGDLRQLPPTLVSGEQLAWEPLDRTWHIMIAPAAACSQQCDEVAKGVDLVWQLLGRHADRVDVMWLGQAPAQLKRYQSFSHSRLLQENPAIRAELPRVNDAKGLPVYLIDPNGFVVMRYEPGFDPGGLHKDLTRLLKVN